MWLHKQEREHQMSTTTGSTRVAKAVGFGRLEFGNSHRDAIIRQKQEIIEKYGPWTAHNIQLADDIYTIDKALTGDEFKLRRIVQIVSDISQKPLHSLRVLDLACLEGMYAIEMARHGAEAVGIEGREASIEKARFAKNVLGLDRLQLLQDDVRNLSREKHGDFDVVLCLGILYHLDSPDVFSFLARLAEVCRGFAIIHTHVALDAEVSRDYEGTQYWGRMFSEHAPGSTPEQRKKSLWASLDNVASFWPTRQSLFKALSKAGFTSIYECQFPPEEMPIHRATIVAIKGRREPIHCAPLLSARAVESSPEQTRAPIARLLPRRMKDLLRGWMRW
jgi:2-polyprenyl-3-methyl-5-hydroxy-6-metoxy-1,4-benzoquinol methylase